MVKVRMLLHEVTTMAMTMKQPRGGALPEASCAAGRRGLRRVAGRPD